MEELNKFNEQLESVSDVRKPQLIALAELIKSSIEETGAAHVNFICTHNSRRSQLGELLLIYLCRKAGIKNVFTYSGGTEATAFNHRMVEAVRHFGFDLKTIGGENNPLYLYSLDSEDHYFFSKKYDHPFNPTSQFVAVTVCSDAEENCPLIQNSRARFHLGYIDPKVSDDTPQEKESYQNKVREVAGEMDFLVKQLQS